MRIELAGPNQCAVPFLNRADANLCWYYYTAATIAIDTGFSPVCMLLNAAKVASPSGEKDKPRI